MAELSSKFTREDLETLVEAMGDWEAVGNHDYYAMELVRRIPIPPEDSESHEVIVQAKDYFKKREKEIKAAREVRQEKAIFLKAKLLMTRQEVATDRLFDLAAAVDPDSVVPVKESAGEECERISPQPNVAELQQRLENAEYYIRDVGIWKQYQAFLAEKAEEKNS